MSDDRAEHAADAATRSTEAATANVVARPEGDAAEGDAAAPGRSDDSTERAAVDAEGPGAANRASDTSQPPPQLTTADRLLRGAEIELEETSQARRVLHVVASVFALLFVAYHVTVLVVYNTPSKAVGRQFHNELGKWTYSSTYFRAAGLSQSWSMFAPNPNRTNAFIKVVVVDAEGNHWDMRHDIYGNDRFPYLWYDRIGKVNRRLDGKKTFQKSYGAWVCRDWELTHDGDRAREVRFVKLATKVPDPWDPKPRNGGLGYQPWSLPVKISEQERVDCAREEGAQLTNEQRRRHGLPEVDETSIVTPKITTWVDRWSRTLDRTVAKAKSISRRAAIDPEGVLERARLEREAAEAAANPDAQDPDDMSLVDQ